MAVLVVTRHDGAVEWLQRRGYAGARRVVQFDPTLVGPGDVVVGTLPIQLVADLTARQIRYLHLVMELTQEVRELRSNLTADEMDRYGARLEEYEARRV